MIVSETKRDVEQGGLGRVVQAKIKASRKLFNFFSDGLYSNKMEAICRELVANAVDSHVMAGRADRPVEVVLPTSLEPTFAVRDFGTGMSEEFLFNNYLVYAEGSTKDNSNEAIGGFGVGKAAVFSYTDQFTLRSVQDGVLGIYSVFIGDDGIPAIAQLDTTSTSEPNGVEITFPVEEADITAFHEAAQKALAYFKPLPLVVNGTLNPPDYTYTGKGWALRAKAGPLGVILGGVYYPTVTQSFAYNLRTDKRLSPLLEYGIDLDIPIGAVDIALSREALSYTARTSEGVQQALENVIDDVVKTFANIFESAPSEWDAMKMLAAEIGTSSSGYYQSRSARAQLLAANARYRGQPLRESFQAADVKDAKAWVIDPVSRRRGRNRNSIPPAKWTTTGELYTITPGHVQTIIIDDLPVSPKSKTIARIREFVTGLDQSGSQIVLRGHKDNLLRMLRNPTDYVLTSSLPEPAATVSSTGKAVRPRVRMFTHSGGLDRWTQSKITNLTPAVSKDGIIGEIEYANQPASGIMVVMNSFDVPDQFYTRMETELVRYDELVFVNAGDAPKIKATFRDFHDVFAERLDAKLKLDPELPKRLAYRNAASPYLAYLNQFSHIESHLAKMSAAAEKRPVGQLYKIWSKYLKSLSAKDVKFAPLLPASATPVIADVAGLVKKLKDSDAGLLLEVLPLRDTRAQTLLMKHI